MAYIVNMLWRTPRGRPNNAPAAFIHPCRPTVAEQPPRGPGWAHELKHDGYRLQVHVRDGRVRLYTMNGADWTEALSAHRRGGRADQGRRHPRRRSGLPVAGGRSRLRRPAQSHHGSRRGGARASICSCATATICGGGRWSSARPPWPSSCSARATASSTSSTPKGHGDKMFAAVCDLGLEGIVSKKLDAPYRSGPSKGVDQGQEPEGTGGHARSRWGVLKAGMSAFGGKADMPFCTAHVRL